MPELPPLTRRLLAEFVGTGLLVAVVIGSGITAQRLSATDTGLQLLQNSVTTVFGLGVLILLLGPASGAHFNPVVSAPIGAALAVTLYPDTPQAADDVVIPHATERSAS